MPKTMSLRFSSKRRGTKKIEFLYLKIDFASANSTDPNPGDMYLAVNVPVMTVHQGLSSLPR